MEAICKNVTILLLVQFKGRFHDFRRKKKKCMEFDKELKYMEYQE